MGAFITVAGRARTDINQFHKEAADGHSLKYKAQSGVKHYLYFPYTAGQTVGDDGQTVTTRNLIAMSGEVHEWNDREDRYHATICLRDIVRHSEDGSVCLNDGTCPICSRVADGWSEYRYRMEQEEKRCDKVGPEREKHMEGVKAQLLKERKASEARPYIYILMAQFKLQNSAPGHYDPVIGENGLPEYDLKVIKMSAKAAEDLNVQMLNSGLGGVAGNAVLIDYPRTDDARLLAKDRRITAVQEVYNFCSKYPGLEQSINEDVAKFDWSGLEKSFREWEGMTTEGAKKCMDDLFRNWDTFKEQSKLDPVNARYLGYGGAATMPDIGSAPVGIAAPYVPSTPAAPAGVVMPGGAVAAPAAPTAPVAPVATTPSAPAAPVVPEMGLPDINAVLGATTDAGPGINI